MAHVTDLIIAVRRVGPRVFFTTLRHKIVNDRLTTHAAAVAYAWLFALFPFLIFLLTLFAYVPTQFKVNARREIIDVVNQNLAHEAAMTIVVNLDQILHESHTTLLSVGVVLTLWIASGGMSMTMTALDTAFNAGRPQPFYKQRPMAILLTLVITLIFVAIFVLLPVGWYVERWLKRQSNFHLSTAAYWAITVARYALAFVLTQALLSLLYKFGTCVKRRFDFLSPGALFTVLVWFVLGVAFRIYVDRFGQYQKTYGAVGGVTILLLFFYLDALVLLVGAEIDSAVDQISRT